MVAKQLSKVKGSKTAHDLSILYKVLSTIVFLKSISALNKIMYAAEI